MRSLYRILPAFLGLHTFLDLVNSDKTAYAFDPRRYEKNTAFCNGTLREDNGLSSVELKLRYVEINQEAENPYTLLMVHGWPGLWSTWAYQIEEFRNDYHLIIPDLRGFGESTHPGNVRTSAMMGDLIGDLVCILEHSGTLHRDHANNGQSKPTVFDLEALSRLDRTASRTARVVCIGHDWGSQVCHEATRMRPDIFVAVVGLVVPYMPSAGPFTSMSSLVAEFPRVAYQLYFDRLTERAVGELDTDIRRSLRATLRTVSSPPPSRFLESTTDYLGAWGSVQTIPPIPFLTPEEEDYLVRQYSIQGFRNTLGFYMTENRQASWEVVHLQGNYSITQPVLAILSNRDPVADWVSASHVLQTTQFIPHLTMKVLDGAHWVHLENPDKVNSAMRDWLDYTLPPVARLQSTADARRVDEL